MRETGRGATTPCYEVFAFGNSPAMAEQLLALVLCGKKRATTSALPVYQAEGTAPPAVGALSVVTNGAGTPRCVIETTAVTTLPFCAVSWEMARREGEDENLESWQAGHRRFFGGEAAACGFTFDESTPVVFEDFRLVWPQQD